MIIKIVELCEVDYSRDSLEEINEEETTRTVIYQSKEETLQEAFRDYQENFDSDNIISSNDDFEGECLDTLEYLSASKVNK